VPKELSFVNYHWEPHHSSLQAELDQLAPQEQLYREHPSSSEFI